MKIVLQRVLEAAVVVDGKEISRIGQGFLAFVGVTGTDTKNQAEILADKIAKLRIFADGAGKSNLSVADIGGEILIVSQFTLYADTRKGNRPSFVFAAPAQLAEELYEYFIYCCQNRKEFAKTAAGIFGADMKINLINDGPYTVVLEV